MFKLFAYSREPKKQVAFLCSLVLFSIGSPVLAIDENALKVDDHLSNEESVKIAVVNLPTVNQTPSQAPEENELAGRINTVDPTFALSRVDNLTKQIILKEIELERFNLHYKQNVGKQGRWKGWRYAAFQEANFGLNLAGSINNAGERGQHLHSPTKLSVNRVAMGNAIGMIGAIIGASAATMEFWINEYHDLEARRKGFSPAAAKKHVLALKAEIDKLLAEREAFIAIEQSVPLLRPHAQVDLAEGKVLKDLRDLGLLEYSHFHIGQRRFIAYQQSLYVFDMAKYTTGAIGSFFAYMSLHKHRRVWNNRAGVLFDISGALTIAAPLASRAIGVGVAKLHSHLISPISKDVETREIATLEADQAALEKLCQGGLCSPDSVRAPVQRAATYGLQGKGFRGELDRSLKANRKAKLVATQSVASGAFVGSTKIASGVLLNVVGKHYNTKSVLSSKITNSDLFASAVCGIVGSGVAVVDTMRIQVQGEITRHKLAKQGLLPAQLLSARLKELDDIEKRIGPVNP